MSSPIRPRRLRRTAAWRDLVRQTHLHPQDLVWPLFVREADSRPIASLPGVSQHNLEDLRSQLNRAVELGIRAVMLFGVPEHRDATGTGAVDPEGILNRAIAVAREQVGEELIIGADVCLDEFTDHGHCGVLTAAGEVDNDATLERYQAMALAQAQAGADLVGLSGMMDHQVGAVRSALDAHGRTEVAILAYAAKYASAFYGPFREAVDSTFSGHRRTYQVDPGNRREGVREALLDVEEGADVVMVKPAATYLDVVADVAAQVPVPVWAYQVSGEYAMLEAAAAVGAIDRRAAVMESLVSIRRAGAQAVCTYYAPEVAQWLTQR